MVTARREAFALQPEGILNDRLSVGRLEEGQSRRPACAVDLYPAHVSGRVPPTEAHT